jgi:hypothetical protein
MRQFYLAYREDEIYREMHIIYRADDLNKKTKP